jgi:hypothetical protein
MERGTRDREERGERSRGREEIEGERGKRRERWRR